MYIFFLQFSCLPVDRENETGIEVKIKHDQRVHSGYCKEPCEDAMVMSYAFSL